MTEVIYLNSNEMYIDDVLLENCSINAKMYRRMFEIISEQSNEFYTDICTFYGDIYGEGTITVDNINQLELIKNNEIKVMNDDKRYYLNNIVIVSVEDNVVKFKIESE